MRLLAWLAIAVIGCGSPPKSTTVAAKTAAVGEHPEMLAMMERYLASPLESTDDLDRIRDFAMQSHDVEIIIDEAAVPFLQEDLDLGVKNLLILGFVAGNAAAQLRARVRRDNVAAGIEGELRVYRALKAVAPTTLKDAKVLSPRLDGLLHLEASGQLDGYVERVHAQRKISVGSSSPTAARHTDHPGRGYAGRCGSQRRARAAPTDACARAYRDVFTLSRVTLNRMPATPAATRSAPRTISPWIDDS
jgi:hypothetical protein